MRLARLEQLCLGDFPAVKPQVDTFGAEFSAADFMDQVEAEQFNSSSLCTNVIDVRTVGP